MVILNLDKFSRTVFKEGVLGEKTEQLIAVTVVHITQCPYFNGSHSNSRSIEMRTNGECQCDDHYGRDGKIEITNY